MIKHLFIQSLVFLVINRFCRFETSELLTYNSTLGFQRVYAINLPERHDRRDMLSIMAFASNIDLTYSDGVRLKTEEDVKAYPPHSHDMPLPKLGCWRAHANVWRKIVEEEIETALILEDDIDWDTDLKSSLTLFRKELSGLLTSMRGADRSESNNFRTLTTTLERIASNFFEISTNSHSPSWQAHDWDILRLGTCLDPKHSPDAFGANVDLDAIPHVVYEDTTVAPYEMTSFEHLQTLQAYGIPLHRKVDKREPEDTDYSALPYDRDQRDTPQFRLIQRSNYPVCLHAYAVSRRGAAKLLLETNAGLIDSANDLTIARLTQQGRLNSYTVIPPLFAQWKSEGWRGNSDIKYNTDQGERMENIMQSDDSLSYSYKEKGEKLYEQREGFAFDIYHSVRKHLLYLI